LLDMSKRTAMRDEPDTATLEGNTLFLCTLIISQGGSVRVLILREKNRAERKAAGSWALRGGGDERKLEKWLTVD